ncbi:MAG: hypothetical protein IPG66_16730 [Hydrogenophilales bacterium]|nr:hypothetical protein [Hydrogenophilales bacterium]
MSLTSQIRDGNSPVRQFFKKFENNEGRRECLKLLQSSIPPRPPQLVNAPAVVYAFVGTASDYLIRYSAGGNSLVFDNTIAHQALEVEFCDKRCLNDLFAIGQRNLDGRVATDANAVYSATALATLDNVYRTSGRLPELFSSLNVRYRYKQLKEHGLGDLQDRAIKAIHKPLWLEAKLQRMLFTHRKQRKLVQSIQHRLIQPKPTPRVALNKKQMEVLGLEIASGSAVRFLVDAELVLKRIGNKVEDCPTESLFQTYYKTLGGDSYTQDVSNIVATFLRAVKDPDSELYNARLVVPNRALANSWLVGGADFDFVVECKGRMILTDIKTTKRPLVTEHIRQLIGYALLYDETKDDFTFSDVGIYHSRSGSIRSLPLDSVIRKYLPSFKSISQAREQFISEIATAE